ncbi:MAG TPA: VOC family protein [Dehalococcoidia bacterium]|nr:VOC family protein [Dehalococcoidia bacterium]HIL30453.1 VOC family protein [Dehalococcoidia bacterium]
MSVQSISAVTLDVANMAISVDFYREKLGLEMLYGGTSASFTSFRVGEAYLNLTLNPERTAAWWGRLIFHVDDVDALHERLVQSGLTPSTKPADAPWGERYFHIEDPDAHELSFARRI